jgi:pimeloyl-ACP methyl ester carboxylesterase
VWAPVADRLVAAGRHVWSFDFRGHGDSSSPPPSEPFDPETEPYAWGGFADDALAVVDHLDVAGDPALLACGHSKGAAALLLGEAKQPATYLRMWAFEPIVFPMEAAHLSADDFPLAGNARKRRNEWPSIDDVYNAYSSKPPLNVMTPESLRAYVEYGLRDRGDGVFELKCAPDVESRVYFMAPAGGVWDVLPRVESTVSVVCGEVSTDIAPQLAQRISERLPHATLEVWPGCGHFGPQQDPDKCATSILDFAKV